MGYYKSQNAILKVKTFLDAMVKADSDLEFAVNPDQEPSKIAYAIRQGIKAAAGYGIKEYAGLGGKYIVRSQPGKVLLELRNKLPMEMFKKAISNIVITEAHNLTQVVGAAVKHAADEMYFPNANIEENGLTQLYAWTTTKGYKIIKNDVGITLTKKEVGELEWKPQIVKTS
jgi:hypothetical protein